MMREIEGKDERTRNKALGAYERDWDWGKERVRERVKRGRIGGFDPFLTLQPYIDTFNASW